MRDIFRFWFVDSLFIAWAATKKVLAELEGNLAVVETARNLGKPLFQDYTLQGRMIGFFLRVGRIFVGVFVYSLVAILCLALYILFVASPILFAYATYSGLTSQTSQIL